MRKTLLSLGVMMMLLVAAACGGGGAAETPSGQTPANGNDTNTNKPPVAIAPKTDPVELTFYNMNAHPEERWMSEFGNTIKAKFPHVTANYIGGGNLEALITSGTQIDAMLLSIGGVSDRLLKFGYQYDISDLMKRYNYDSSQLEPSTIEIQKYIADGGVYGLPVRTSTYTLFYNRDLFNKFGVPFPKEGMNWDELYEVSRRMTRIDDGKQYIGFVMSAGHMLSHNQLSQGSVNLTGTEIYITQDKYKNMLTNWLRFYQVPGAETYKNGLKTNTTNHKNIFSKDQTAAMFAFSTVWRDEMMRDVNWDVVPLPVFKEKPSGPQSYPEYFFVTNTSKHKEQMFEIISHFTTKEFQTHVSRNGMPTILTDREIVKEFAQGPDWKSFYEGKNIAALVPASYASPVPWTEYSNAVERRVVAAMEKTIFEGIDLNTAMREAEELGRKDIEELKSK